MNSITLSVNLLLLVLTLPRSASICEEQNKPLLLSPLLAKNQVDKARLLSKVDKDSLKDFVPDSHTGFITVDRELGNHLFFWFFPSTKKENAPLLLWLNGGPTVSSMFGLLWENGPMEVLRKVKPKMCNDTTLERDYGYIQRQHSWTNSFSMLYVDTPVEVGYSFSDSGKKGYRTDEEGYTKDMYAFLEQFFEIFHEYKNGDFYLGGQSYAGKYIANLGLHIHNYNKLHPKKSGFTFTGIYFGAPWFDPESGSEALFDFPYNLGMISRKTLLDGKKQSQRLYWQLRTGAINKTTFYNLEGKLYGNEHIFCRDNIITREKPGDGEVTSLMNSPEFKRACHAGNRTFKMIIGDYIDMMSEDAYIISALPKVGPLLDNYKVLVYNGDLDMTCSTHVIESALMKTRWSRQGEYNAATKTLWRRDAEVIGTYSLTDRFCRVVVHGGGHLLPRDKPEISLTMLEQFIKDGCVSDIS